MRTKIVFKPPQLPLLAAILMLLLLFNCTSTTRITGTWRNQDVNKTYENIVVAAITDNIKARQEMENDLQIQLQQRGIKASKSLDFFPPSLAGSNEPDMNLLVERIKGKGIDGILTIALVDKETRTRYVPGYYRYDPMVYYGGWYGSFWGYYSYWYPMLYEPGYYTEEEIYYVETNLYDVSTDVLMWSAKTRSYSPSKLRKEAEKFSELIVTRLGQENLIHPTLQEQ